MTAMEPNPEFGIPNCGRGFDHAAEERFPPATRGLCQTEKGEWIRCTAAQTQSRSPAPQGGEPVFVRIKNSTRFQRRVLFFYLVVVPADRIDQLWFGYGLIRGKGVAFGCFFPATAIPHSAFRILHSEFQIAASAQYSNVPSYTSTAVPVSVTRSSV